ncbi:heme NO-binding domain-containing protein [Sediminicola sp. 1XM1-17]|uniref:heme NO-binding domain-containing protein n=1 Tax=Sediminicola sp. 1XM1-17 TaxID=3127702 RepID=UPI003076AD2E
MKGIIFNIAEQFITTHYGDDTLETIMEDCKLITKDPFVGPGTYPDGDLLEIVRIASEKVELHSDEFLKRLGHFTFGKLAERHPYFVANYEHPKQFLLTVDNVIHVEVRKLYNGTQLPMFQYAEPNAKELIITYYSKRKMYALMEGLINGVADHFNIAIEQQQNKYIKDGNEFCNYHLKFAE